MPANIIRRLPGGYGTWSGETAYLDNASDQAGRNSQQESAGGWWITSAGDAFLTHHESAGVSFTANQLSFIPLAPRMQSAKLCYARINVLTASAGATFQSALYFYDSSEQALRKCLGTGVTFNAATTGLKTATLVAPVDIIGPTPLFLAQWTNSAAIAVTGFLQGGSKVLSSRTITTTTPMAGQYPLDSIAKESGTNPVGLVAYLSRTANIVI